LDKDGDGKVTPEEFAAVGTSGLPSFEDIGAEGHHYDVESGKFGSASHPKTMLLSSQQEFFLHHEGSFMQSMLSQILAQTIL
jgi:hypothetical protein